MQRPPGEPLPEGVDRVSVQPFRSQLSEAWTGIHAQATQFGPRYNLGVSTLGDLYAATHCMSRKRVRGASRAGRPAWVRPGRNRAALVATGLTVPWGYHAAARDRPTARRGEGIPSPSRTGIPA
jgi:hypothetical protein